MPEFIPQHTPDKVDEFTKGYLSAIEWLLPEVCDSEGNIIGPPPHDEVVGFHPDTIKDAVEDCANFQAANVDTLELYYAAGHTANRAGVDLWLTRNHHGAGFWDRGNEPFYDELTDTARLGERDIWLTDDGLIQTS